MTPRQTNGKMPELGPIPDVASQGLNMNIFLVSFEKWICSIFYDVFFFFKKKKGSSDMVEKISRPSINQLENDGVWLRLRGDK